MVDIYLKDLPTEIFDKIPQWKLAIKFKLNNTEFGGLLSTLQVQHQDNSNTYILGYTEDRIKRGRASLCTCPAYIYVWGAPVDIELEFWEVL